MSADPHASHQADHQFFIPAPSIWPPLTCLGAGLLAFGLIAHLHVKPAIIGNGMMLSGTLLIILAAAQWFAQMIKESRARGKVVPVVIDLANRYGMIFFIASEVMFFAAFFAAYFYLRLHAPEWPPANIEALPIHLPILGTLILLTSGASVTWAHHSLLMGRRSDAVLATAITWQLGLIFTALQLFEYSHATFGFGDGVYASVFYLLTGFHGVHVFIGTCMLMVAHWRMQKGHFTRQRHFYFEAAAWYWHFVDVVWIGLFLFIYVL